PQDTHVRGDEPAVIGVLINLLSNAALALRKAERAEPRIDVVGLHQDGRLQVSVRDNGTGIDAEHLNRVFEPFFTTRTVGQGLGLGLSVSYAVIQRHGGTLRVASEPGAWTEFSFDLGLPDPAAV
ncbi:MAG: GHKL domain-containing protein, partial [Proteobacteria bacterium]|nr:GHKL domain-containing protein [Pseudomonadota bacterium]